MMSSEVTSAAAAAPAMMKEVEEELELGLSLGANTSTRNQHYCCRILTAKDFPPPESSSSSSSSQPSSQVVGWPPIRAFRMNSLHSSKPNNSASDVDACAADNKKNRRRGHGHGRTSCRFVKVNKDGDPIGRKVDLGAHASYETLAAAVDLMFRKPTAAPSSDCNSAEASKLLLVGGSSDFALTYKDKDGDWMLVGDVPYGMFLDTVKRLRIMRTSDASGLAPTFQPSASVS
ncbi:auxin-responsive protein IAA10-like [Iris pallida]|uniref:Auxin-responsive protein n=1 Tax=Iris pallida TaxID=29817 RepID=A0AAX6GF59_IRIPA|nr:auxin-responsive protein IAA10-like [Iris pallida]